VPGETWGLPGLAQEPDTEDWNLTCDYDNAPFECKLGSKAIGVTIIGRKPLNDIPRVEFLTSGNARGGDTAILVDGMPRTLSQLKTQADPTNMALVAELCSASRIKNVDQGYEVSLDGFCPKLAIMFAQLLTCSGPVGPLGDKISDPNPTLFDPKNFVHPAFTDDGEWLEFQLTRLNEGFYTKTDMTGKLSITIAAGDTCDKKFHLEFPLTATGTISYGPSRDPFTDKWSSSIAEYDIKNSVGYLHGYLEEVTGSAFHPSSYKCYKATVLMEYYFRFRFSYGGHSETVVYRVPYSSDEPPSTATITPATEETFLALNDALEKRKATTIDLIMPQEIAIAFDKIGLPTHWQEFAYRLSAFSDIG